LSKRVSPLGIRGRNSLQKQTLSLLQRNSDEIAALNEKRRFAWESGIR
jgi:hypothetical protein